MEHKAHEVNKEITSKCKNAFRREMLAKRKKLSAEGIAARSKNIADKVVVSDFYIKSEVLLLYLPLKNEVDTWYILTHAINNKKKILVPVTNGKEMFAAEFTEDRIKGDFGTEIPRKCVCVEKSSIDCVIAPGVVFDRKKNRLGYGKGFYDFYLSDFSGMKIGLCYDFQLIDKIPSQSHDVKMDIIISESGILT